MNDSTNHDSVDHDSAGAPDGPTKTDHAGAATTAADEAAAAAHEANEAEWALIGNTGYNYGDRENYAPEEKPDDLWTALKNIGQG